MTNAPHPFDGRMTYQLSFEQTGWYDVDFCANDKKGRALGTRIYLGVAVHVPYEDRPTDASQYATGYRIAAGTHFTLCVHTMRNGQTFGASQSRQYFATSEEREAAVNKYLAAARKRAAKLAA